MLTTGTQNLPETPAQAQEHFASSVQFVLGDPDAARHLHALTKDLRPGRRLGTLLPQVRGDFGNIQIVDPATGSLRLAIQAGFGPEFLDYFAVVEDVHSVYGRTARQGALHPGRPFGEGPADTVGRALVTALLDPARVREPDLPVPLDLWVMRRMTMGLAHWAGLAGGAPSPPDGGQSP
jgi:hypothetical protein